MKKCPYCSQNIYDGALRCPFCGRNLDFELAKKLEKERTDREKFDRQLKVTLISFVIIVSATVLILWTAIYSPIGFAGKQSATQTAIVLDRCNPERVGVAANQLIDFNDRWADIMTLATSIDQDALVLQVDRLQKIRRDVKEVGTPDCLQEAKSALIAGMDDHINGLLEYLRGVPTERVNETLTKGNFSMNTFADEVERIQRCAPNCP